MYVPRLLSTGFSSQMPPDGENPREKFARARARARTFARGFIIIDIYYLEVAMSLRLRVGLNARFSKDPQQSSVQNL